MRIAIDLDGTLRPMVEGYIDYIKRQDVLTDVKVEDIFWDHEIFELEHFKEYFNNHVEMIRINPYPYCKNVIELWKEMGHKIIILTSTFQPAGSVRVWLTKHRIKFDELIITQNKGEAEYDLLIDNKQTMAEEIPGDRAIMFKAQPWNKDLEKKYYRCPDWVHIFYCWLENYSDSW